MKKLILIKVEDDTVSVETTENLFINGRLVTLEQLTNQKSTPYPAKRAACCFCGQVWSLELMHRHQGRYVGECGWDARLRATE